MTRTQTPRAWNKPLFFFGLLAWTGTLCAPVTPVEAQEQAPCTSPKAHQFDFWIGEWEVRRPDGSLAGRNTISRILNGCVIKESYRTPAGYAGESFNIYDASRDVWHQTWVDVQGVLLTLEGRFDDGTMVLEGTTEGPDGPVRQRIRWSQVDGDSSRVRQLWEQSEDDGRSWSVVFDGRYVRVQGRPEE